MAEKTQLVVAVLSLTRESLTFVTSQRAKTSEVKDLIFVVLLPGQ